MFKVTPNPPETDPVSPYESLNSKKLHEAAERALDHYLLPAGHIMASVNEPERMYLANPKYDSESLLANASETLSSASEIAQQLRRSTRPLAPQNRVGHCAGGDAGGVGGESGVG